MLKGVVGYIRWRIYTAAQVEGYTVTRNKAGTVWNLTCNLVHTNAFNLAQTPLTFVATFVGRDGKGKWTFPIISHTRVEHRFTAVLGPPDPGKGP
jgi:hypothetical protein